VLSVDHTEIGYLIAERWNLPNTLCAVIRHHHEPEQATDAGDGKLLQLVAAANVFCKMKHLQDPAEIEAMAKEYAASPHNYCSLDAAQVVAALHEYWAGRDEAMRLFGPRGSLDSVTEGRPSVESAPA
jgi:HD-like signal output (HDOD) protein